MPKAKPTTKKSASSSAAPKRPRPISAHWRDLFGLLPGYNPGHGGTDFWFDAAEADLRVEFFPTCLRHIKGVPGRPPYVLAPWEQAVIGCLFGWKIVGTSLRRYRECLLYIPRKNDKTNLAAGLALNILAMDDEPGAEIYAAASTEEQAQRLWSYARPMVLADPVLRQKFQVYETAKSIVYAEQDSAIKIISGIPEGKHGFNSHVIIIDELHEQPDRKLLDALLTSMSSRRQPLLIYLTTADFARPSVCNEKYDYACRVRDGVVEDPAFLPVIFEVGHNDLKKDPEAWKKEKYWYKANPNLGVSKSLTYMHRECLRAQNEPSYLNTFLRLELNIQTQQDIHWVDPSAWAACVGEVTEDDLVGKPCWAGLDLAATSDLCSMALYFPHDGHRVLSYSWVPEDQVTKRAARGQQDYMIWVRQGWLQTTPGNVTDYDFIRAAMRGLGEKFLIQAIAMDRWNSQNLENQFTDDGFQMVRFGQGFQSMREPMKEIEKLIMGQKLQHGGNSVLTWCAGNVQASYNAAGDVKPDKSKSMDKIDAFVALVMAVGMYLLQPTQGEPSIYETRGVLVL